MPMKAIQKVASFKPELVLMDIQLGSGKDGIETTKIIRDRFHVPVVFVTSHSDQKTLERVKYASPLGYINKPIRDKDLMTTLTLALEKARDKEFLTANLDSGEPVDLEILCESDGTIRDYNQAATDAVKEFKLDSVQELLPHNHRQIIEYSLRIGNSYLVAGRLMNRIFSWEYNPDNDQGTVRVSCEDLTHNRRISEDHSTEKALKQTLNHLSVGVILVNKKLEPTFINIAAKNFVELDNRLDISNDTLSLSCSEDDNELFEMVCSTSGGVITLNEENSPSSIELLVSPIDIDDKQQNANTPVAIIFVFHAQKDAERFEELLRGLYHFTNAEARLVSALVQDPRLEQAASSIGIKVNTARSHLKRIFHKTGTDRQSSLINHIVRGPAGLIIKTGKG